MIGHKKYSLTNILKYGSIDSIEPYAVLSTWQMAAYFEFNKAWQDIVVYLKSE
jgi:hypothetical protein